MTDCTNVSMSWLNWTCLFKLLSDQSQTWTQTYILAHLVFASASRKLYLHFSQTLAHNCISAWMTVSNRPLSYPFIFFHYIVPLSCAIPILLGRWEWWSFQCISSKWWQYWCFTILLFNFLPSSFIKIYWHPPGVKGFLYGSERGKDVTQLELRRWRHSKFGFRLGPFSAPARMSGGLQSCKRKVRTTIWNYSTAFSMTVIFDLKLFNRFFHDCKTSEDHTETCRQRISNPTFASWVRNAFDERYEILHAAVAEVRDARSLDKDKRMMYPLIICDMPSWRCKKTFTTWLARLATLCKTLIWCRGRGFISAVA